MTVDMGEGQARFQMVLPISSVLSEVAGAIEQTASQAGLLMMKALIDEEVEQIAGGRYRHQADRQATRWGHEEGHVVFCGRKVAIERPRVRTVEGREVPLQRYQAFAHPQRMQESVSQRILRRVSTRDYGGVLDEVCEGYGIRKSSVSRHWKDKAAEQAAVYGNRRRTRGKRGKALLRRRGELLERPFAHCYGTGGLQGLACDVFRMFSVRIADLRAFYKEMTGVSQRLGAPTTMWCAA